MYYVLEPNQIGSYIGPKHVWPVVYLYTGWAAIFKLWGLTYMWATCSYNISDTVPGLKQLWTPILRKNQAETELIYGQLSWTLHMPHFDMMNNGIPGYCSWNQRHVLRCFFYNKASEIRLLRRQVSQWRYVRETPRYRLA